MKAKFKASAIFKSSGPADTLKLAAIAAAALKGGEIISLKGMIGAGKTFFVKGLALALGAKDIPVSASFNLMRTYRAGLKIYHFDLFRVSREEMGNIGMEEYLGRRDGVAAIEWADPARELFERMDFIEMDIDLAGGDKRVIKARASGPSAKAALERMRSAWRKN